MGVSGGMVYGYRAHVVVRLLPDQAERLLVYFNTQGHKNLSDATRNLINTLSAQLYGILNKGEKDDNQS